MRCWSFPARRSTTMDLLHLGRLLGDVEPPRNHRVQQRLKHAELADISNLTADNALRAHDDQRRLNSLGNRLWHSDASFREVPGALSMLFAHIVPPAGGETEFADLRQAVDPASKERPKRITILTWDSIDPMGKSVRLRRRRGRAAARPAIRDVPPLPAQGQQ